MFNTEKKSRLTIGIPCFNFLEGLKNILEVICKDDIGLEVIVGDDSTDDEIEKYIYSMTFPRNIRFIYLCSKYKRTSHVSNWNRIIDSSTGDYLLIMHHDDKPASQRFVEEILEILDREPDVCFLEPVTLVNNKLRSIYPEYLRRFYALYGLPNRVFDLNFAGPPSIFICRREAYLKYDERLMILVDTEQMSRVLRKPNLFCVFAKTKIITSTKLAGQVTNKYKANGDYYNRIRLERKIMNAAENRSDMLKRIEWEIILTFVSLHVRLKRFIENITS